MEPYSGSLKGHFLVAMPSLADPNFSHTVTCVCEHSTEGTMGVVINRVHPSLSAKDIFEELGIEAVPRAQSIPIHLGGPVHLNEIFMLHGPPFDWEGCLRITPELGMSNTQDLLEAVARGEGPESMIIAIGCAGWGPRQLEDELRENAWLTTSASVDILFDLDIEARWEAAVRKLGIDPNLLSESAGNA